MPAARRITAAYWVMSFFIWGSVFAVYLASNAIRDEMWVDVMSQSGGSAESAIVVVLRSIIGTLLVFAYFLPIQIAVYRSHPFVLPIVMVDVFGGWTCIGWIAALTWSVWPIDRRE